MAPKPKPAPTSASQVLKPDIRDDRIFVPQLKASEIFPENGATPKPSKTRVRKRAARRSHGIEVTADDIDIDAQFRQALREALDDVAPLSSRKRNDVLETLAKHRARLAGGNFVRTIRKETDTKLAQLQSEYGIRPATVSDIENAKNPNGPDLYTLELLAHVMGKRLMLGFEDID